MNQLEKIAYDVKYTSFSYVDALLSIPIVTSQKIYDTYDRISKNASDTSTWNLVKQKSIVFQAREKLRLKHDTQPGVKYIASNMVALPAFFYVGAPIAQKTYDVIQFVAPNTNQIAQFALNGVSTVIGQLLAGYVAFQASDVIQNSYLYRDENKKLSPKKMLKALLHTTKSFLKFDIPYIGAKTIGQSYLMLSGKNPAKASELFDIAGIPIWYAIMIPIGIRYNLIDNKETQKRNSKTS